jgi:LPS-assembly protein
MEDHSTPAEAAPLAPAVVLPAATAEADADDRWALCPPVSAPAGFEADLTGEDIIDLRADSANATPERIFTLSGDATIRYGNKQLQASQLTYRQQTGEVEASGGIRFTGPDLLVTGESALLQTDQERGTLNQISYSMPAQHIRGEASRMQLDGTDRQQFEGVSYTTCPPGNNDWQLTAEKVELDHEAGSGVARDAKITFKEVPILYTPYISFPLSNKRKSGLLFPRAGTTAETGIDVSIPWYWNIAPNRDATFTPRLMSDRGTQLASEFRYLNRRSEGELGFEYLPSDRKYNSQSRSLVTLQHNGNPTPRLETRINASDTSDRDYFEDLGNDLVQTSQTSLERTAGATYHGRDWVLGLVVQDFQNLDGSIASSERPYRQLPQIRLDYTPPRRLLGIKGTAEAEVNYFTHPDNTVVTGTRLDITPRLSVPVQHAGWYVEPALGLRHTAYELDNTAPGAATSPTRTTPVASLDAGSFFERNGSWRQHAYVQTLEPRMYYLYVPEENQDELPVFDTGNYDFNYWALFRDNRFNGPDRMGDANQLALAMTTRFLDPASGEQMLGASLGSLLYFRDRTVTLPGSTVDLENSSDLIGELNLTLTRFWNARAEMMWNPHQSSTERSNYRLQYRRGPRQLINLGYRYRDAGQEQGDFSFLWPIGRSWHAVGRWYYDLDSQETIEALAGLGYDSCCWGVQLLGRTYINSDGVDRTNAAFLQIELKGLGNLGTSVDDALERGILGYRANH